MTGPTWTIGTCPVCGTSGRSIGPLHGEKGGPPYCLQCGMAWHARNGRKRKMGRIVVKAVQLFMQAGGELKDIDMLKHRAVLAGSVFSRAIGCEDDAIGADVGDITVELLRDTLKLTHPDVHPPERRELAERVTRDLRALEPYVFPAPATPPAAAPSSAQPAPSSAPEAGEDLSPSTAYPCELCRETYPGAYCDACRAEWERRQEPIREKERAQRRRWYRTRRERELTRRRREGRPTCATCRQPFERRTDAKYCGAACRQRAYRRRVTDTSSLAGGELRQPVTRGRGLER